MNDYNNTKWSEKNVDVFLNALVEIFAGLLLLLMYIYLTFYEDT